MMRNAPRSKTCETNVEKCGSVEKYGSRKCKTAKTRIERREKEEALNCYRSIRETRIISLCIHFVSAISSAAPCPPAPHTQCEGYYLCTSERRKENTKNRMALGI